MKKLLLLSFLLLASMVQAQVVGTGSAETERPSLYRIGNTYYYGQTVMDKKAYMRFLQDNCAVAHQQFRQGYRTAIAGWVLLGVGLGIDISASTAGVVMATKSGRVSMASIDPSTRSVITSVAMIGLACEIACIPTLCVGYAKMHNSVNTFNAACPSPDEARAYWSINASGNCIGLAYHF